MNDTPHIPTQFIAPVDAPAPMPSAEQHDRPTASRPTCPSTGTFTCPPQTACDTCAPLCVDMGDVAPERDAEAVDATPAEPWERHPDDPEFRHRDGSPSQIPKPPHLLDDAPERCTGACPPQQVCDVCQYPEGVPDASERDAEAVDDVPAAPAPRPDVVNAEGPAPMAAGTYAVYDDQAGGYVLVVATREGQTHHKHIPARVVKMAEMAMGGNSPLAAMFGGI